MASSDPSLNFFTAARPVRGQPWLLPRASELPALPPAANSTPGYGCFMAPLQPVGIPVLDNETVACPAGFLCPFFVVGNAATAPVSCPPDPICALTRLESGICLPQGRYEAHYGLIVIVVLLDLALACHVIISRARDLRKGGAPASAMLPHFIQRMLRISKKKEKVDEPVAPIEISGKKTKVAEAVVSLEDTEEGIVELRIRKLIEGFRKAFGGDDSLRMDFSFEGLGLTLPGGKSILKGVSGRIRSGRMTAIMGPSGAGKTTFMNVLMGKAKRTGGELRINGVTAELAAYKRIIGYVPQEDIMHRELTCMENIHYSAKCRLPKDWTAREIEEHANNVVDALNLRKVAHVPIGDELTRGVSGGQRKRVNVGTELASSPLSLFLDEPTSGLDSTSALDLSSILRSIARLGLTVVAVIHQPRVEIFNAFDDVLMIAPGGRTAYFGPTAGARAYFEGMGMLFEEGANAADVLMDILSGRGRRRDGGAPPTPDDIVGEWERRVQSEILPGGMPPAGTSADADVASASGVHADAADPEAVARMATIVKARGAGVFMQAAHAHGRSMLQQRRLVGALALELFVGTFAGGIMGLSAQVDEGYVGVYVFPFELISSAPMNWFLALYGMLIGVAIALAGGPSGVKVFGEEKPVYWREAASGHNKVSYYIGKSVSVLYRIALSAIHFTALYYFLAKPPVPLGYQIALIMMNFFCKFNFTQTDSDSASISGMAVVVSMLVRRENASLLAIIIGLFSAVFCGFGLDLKAAATNGYIFIFDLGGNRWAAEAQFGLWIEWFAQVYDRDLALEYCGYQGGVADINLLTMLGIGVAYRVIGFVLMVVMNRDKQK
ncbi:hypothetical protein HK101_007396 [Irineochytrium annulatum]|nr:hypothetical protein HK101_007396 [Irineochytrium annulatum]